jgi:hypothetical protein
MEEVILKFTDPNSVHLNLYGVFVLKIQSAKPAYSVLAGTQFEGSSIFVLMLWRTHLCGIGCCHWPECVILVKGYSDRPQ